MRFALVRNKDAGEPFANALTSHGYERVGEISEADFILFDSEHNREEIRNFNKHKFIYPHTPLTCFLWDGIVDPIDVDCNFVSGEGAEEIMDSYGYKSRIEVVGFPRCEVLPFEPTDGTKLLFVPSRPMKDLGFQKALDTFALRFILRYRMNFEKVTICHTANSIGCHHYSELPNVDYIISNPNKSKDPTREMVERIKEHDVVIAVHTVAALSVACGKPTIFYGQYYPPTTMTGRKPHHYKEWRDLYDFPITLEDLSIGGVMRAKKQESIEVASWKREHIGTNFDTERFVSIVAETLSQ